MFEHGFTPFPEIECEDDILKSEPVHMTISEMVGYCIKSIARKHGVSVVEMKGDGRCKQLTAARWEAYEALRRRFGFSYPRIGRIMGDRHHTTIMAGIKRYYEVNGVAAE